MCQVSICIPTNGRLDILRKTLESIYINCNVQYSDFEVVLADNATNNDLSDLLNDFNIYPNIIYSKSYAAGYLNSIYALKLGKGKLLKLHNNYTKFLPGALHDLVELVKSESCQRPIIFFKNSGQNKSCKFNSFDEFSFNLSYWNTWSTGISIWKDDFDVMKSFEYNKMFPHVTLLLSQSFKNRYVIDDTIYFINQDIIAKGGYNLFRTFAVEYLEIMKQAVNQNLISLKTFIKIKEDLFFNYLPIWFFNTKIKNNNYTFDLTNIKESILVYYGPWGYYKLIFLSYLLVAKKILKYLVNIKFVKKK